MRNSSVNIWHAVLLLLIFSMINLAAIPFSFAAIGQTTSALSFFVSSVCSRNYSQSDEKGRKIL